METAVLLHGFAFNSLQMTQIHRQLKRSQLFDEVIAVDFYNFPVNINRRAYTINSPILRVENGIIEREGTIVENVYNQIKPHSDSNLHLMGYSMGGLVGRALNLAYKKLKIRSMLSIASPNNGTEISGFRALIGDPLEVMGNIYQLEQMRKNSKFIGWLNNSSEDFTHLGVVGSRGSQRLSQFDGLVEHKDVIQPNMRMIDLGDWEKEIDHFNIIAWQSLVGSKVRDAVLEEYVYLV